jgi:hypothetical protein
MCKLNNEHTIIVFFDPQSCTGTAEAIRCLRMLGSHFPFRTGNPATQNEQTDSNLRNSTMA